MSKLIASILSTCVWTGTAFAVPPDSFKDLAVVSAIERLERDMGDALVHVDIDRPNQIYADDFIPESAPPEELSLRMIF